MFRASMSWRRKDSRVSPVSENLDASTGDIADPSASTTDALSSEEFLASLASHSLDTSAQSRVRELLTRYRSYRRTARTTTLSLSVANAALQLVNDFVIFFAADGSLMSTNRSLETLVGRERASAATVADLLRDNSKLLEETTAALSSGSPRQGSFRLLNSDTHAAFPVSYSISAVSECGVVSESCAQSEVVAVVLVIRLEQGSLVDDEGVLELARGLVRRAAESNRDKGSLVRLSNIVAALDDVLTLSTIDKTTTELPSEGADLLAMLGCPSLRLVGSVEDWDFDVMQLRDRRDELRALTGHILLTYFNLSELGIDARTLAVMLTDVQSLYHDNPFHNFFHVTTVLHFLMRLITVTGADTVIPPIMLFATAISAVVHDIDHPGHNNAFEINSGSELSLLYGEKSVLENHHISTTFRVLRRRNSNIFANLEPDKHKMVRKLIVSNLIATDMERHFILVDKVKRINLLPLEQGVPPGKSRWNFSAEADSAFFCRLMLHAADLSNPVRPFAISEFWSRCIAEEFTNQVKKERNLGLPFAPFMEVKSELDLCKSEIGFSTFVVLPMWKAIAAVFPVLDVLETQLQSNINTWTDRKDKLLENPEGETKPN